MDGGGGGEGGISLAPKHNVPEIKRSAGERGGLLPLCLLREVAGCHCLDVNIPPVNKEAVSEYAALFVCELAFQGV